MAEERLNYFIVKHHSTVSTQFTVFVSVSASVFMSKSATSELSTGLSYRLLLYYEGVKLS